MRFLESQKYGKASETNGRIFRFEISASSLRSGFPTPSNLTQGGEQTVPDMAGADGLDCLAEKFWLDAVFLTRRLDPASLGTVTEWELAS